MKDISRLFREESGFRLFFVAQVQSALGTGGGYVVLLLIAYDRFRSPWAISLVLIADLLPAMLLGPVFGAAADRWSRRWCAVAADVLRAVAFAGIALVDSYAATVAFAVLAGAGTALFTPATLAGLPSLVAPERLPSATSVYGAVADLGFTAGPALAAAALLVATPEEVTLVNALTFGASAALLLRVRLEGAGPPVEPASRRQMRSLFREARHGLRAVAAMHGVRVVIATSSVALFFGGLFNVAELPFATRELDAGDSGFAILVSLFGLGVIVGSLSGSRGGDLRRLQSGFLRGALLMAVGLFAVGLAPGLGVALIAFAAAGLGNGLLMVYERLILQRSVPDSVLGRAFGVKDSLASWAFAGGFFAAGGLIPLVGARSVILLAATGGLVVWLLTMVGLRRDAKISTEASPGQGLTGRADALRNMAAHEHSTDMVGRGGLRVASLDDSD